MNLAPTPTFHRAAALGFLLLFAPSGFAEVTVHPAAAITHRVQIQPIRVKKIDGTSATTFGNSVTSAYIQEQINAIWAQVGIRIDWLPLVDYTNNFAYQGSGSYEDTARPDGDLELIVDNAGSPPKSANAIVVNMFFVEVVPGFPHLDDNYANGLAFLDSNGVAIHVGQELLTWEEGRDVVASVAAHEIGHNLGLDHYAASQDNLMNASGGSAEYLTTGQKNIVFTNHNWVDGYDFLQVVQGSNYSQWVASHGLENGPEGDDDHDGISNVIEFMLSLDPNAPSIVPSPVTGPDGMTWTFNKNPFATADGLVYRVQSGPSFTSLINAGLPGSGSTVVTDNSSTLVVRLNAGGVKRFMTFRVDSTPVAGASATRFVPAGASQAPRVLPEAEHARSLVRPAFPE